MRNELSQLKKIKQAGLIFAGLIGILANKFLLTL